jgi:dTDP-4-amino-4,6-dideoxygalactose transaminase
MNDKTLQLFRAKYEVEECVKEIKSVLESGWSGLGPRCAEFEKQWNEFTGAEHSHFISSCTAALHLAVRLLDLPKGSGIATTPITFVSTNAAIIYEGHIPFFCDVGDNLSLSFESVKAIIEKKNAKAVMWVHYGGNISDDFYQLMDYIKEHPEIKVIEDCAHAAGAFYNDGKRVGSRKDTTSCFSFHSVKNLPIFDGGMICVQSAAQLDRARRLSWLGIDKSTYSRTVDGSNEVYKWAYDVPELGWKYNANDVAASIGLVQLKYLDRDNAYRRKIYDWYCELLNPQKAELVSHSVGSSHHIMAVYVENRDVLIATLKANGIAPGVHYLPNYKFPVMVDYDHSECFSVEEAFKFVVSLPNHLVLTRKDIHWISEIINNA